MNPTLLLNANATPVSLLPLSTLMWQDAVRLMVLDRADVLHQYEDWAVHSPSLTLLVPAVIMLREHIPGPQNPDDDHVSRPLLFLRDAYTCQYCATQFGERSLTLDHVKPRKYGGRTRWDNVTTACEPCNGRRGHDVRIQPRSQPVRPTYQHLTKMLRRFPLTIPHPTWNYYLGWPSDQVRLTDPKNFHGTLTQHLISAASLV